ncbi:uncharacterized protein V2V93DRAFT_373775 [Kockiozyma suomiensis]|uniref:uncharacterized protein n=1 Tax=Kockiozyma suomiensis TaxID=1337062 RepID=UPI0033433514
MSASDLPSLLQAVNFCVESSESSYSCSLKASLKDLPRTQVRAIALLALDYFLQQNFTGPRLSDIILSSLEAILSPPESAEECVKELSVDSEVVYQHTEQAYLLLLTLAGLSQLVDTSSDTTEDESTKRQDKRWLARALMVQQSILSAPAGTLHDEIFTNLTASAPISTTTDSQEEFEQQKNLTAEYSMELARADIFYSYDARAAKALENAKSMSGLKVKVTGMKALRTKFQTRQHVGLVVLAKSRSVSVSDPPTTSATIEADIKEATAVPVSLPLNSDLLLEAPRFLTGESSEKEEEQNKSIEETVEDDDLASEDPNSPSPLADIDSCILLLTEHRMRVSLPSQDPIVTEQLQAYISRVISASGPAGSVNWTLYSRALWERSILESHSAKTVERGTLQLASLVDELGVASAATSFAHGQSETASSAPAHERLRFIHFLPLMPRWKMDLELAEKYISLGMVRSAQEIYARLRLPIESALCTAAGNESKAEAIKMLEDYIASGDHVDTARAWSCLGDITGKTEYWEKAWEVGRYASAKRSLGEYCFKNGKASESIIHLRDALAKNSLNRNAWFLYGCAGLETERFDVAAEGFTRCVSMDRDDSKAWANLATAFLHMGEQQRAQNIKDGVRDDESSNKREKEAMTALLEACRLNPDDWRLWSNLVIVAARLENWQACLRGSVRMAELRAPKEGEDALDVPVLHALAQILVSDALSDGHRMGEPEKRLTAFETHAIKLFTDTVPKLVTRTPELWSIVAKVEIWRKKPWAALDAYEKMLRLALTVFEADETDAAKWKQAVDTCEMLVDGYVNLGELPGRLGEGQLVCTDWKYRARSTVRSVMGKGRRMWADGAEWERLEKMREDLK